MTIDLDAIDVASPCSASWDSMRGDERVRHCEDCQLNVYNLSEMTRDAARDLIAKQEGRLCVRFYRREDGTLLTRDCPVGLQKLRRAAQRAWVRAAALLACLFPAFVSCTPRQPKRAMGVMGDYCAPEEPPKSAAPLQDKARSQGASSNSTKPTDVQSQGQASTQAAPTAEPKLIEVLGEVELGRLAPIPKDPTPKKR